MADQHVKGAVTEGVGSLIGDRRLETKGKAQKVQGKAQDAVRKDSHA
jgi:uncharacterized protein YjbJ (UPF0337 family)